MEVKLCRITGFCSGVQKALNLTRTALNTANGTPVFILHELVHNEIVVRDLLSHGANIVDNVEGLPPGSTLIFSAHGVSESVENRARSLPLNIVDATCPIVRQVQHRAATLSEEGFTILLFGKKGHREVEGILGRIHGEKHLLSNQEEALSFVPQPGHRYACISQTTMNQTAVTSMTAILRKKIPHLVDSASVCRTTRDRQNAVRGLAQSCDLVLVAGSPLSSNTRRLCEIAMEQGARAILISGPESVTPELIANASSVGITSGASTPGELVDRIYQAVLSLTSRTEKNGEKERES